jgi:hypothetical protein
LDNAAERLPRATSIPGCAEGWLADLLLNAAPPAGYPPVAGGILDLDMSLRIVQECLLGLPEGRSDPAALVRTAGPADHHERSRCRACGTSLSHWRF